MGIINHGYHKPMVCGLSKNRNHNFVSILLSIIGPNIVLLMMRCITLIVQERLKAKCWSNHQGNMWQCHLDIFKNQLFTKNYGSNEKKYLGLMWIKYTSYGKILSCFLLISSVFVRSISWIWTCFWLVQIQ